MRRRAQSTNGKRVRQAVLLAGTFVVLMQQAALAQSEAAQPAQAAEHSASAATAPNAKIRRILISIPDRRLALMENNEVLRVYPIAVGKRDTPSPVGQFMVINRLTDPTWYGAEDGKPVPPGPANPLGTRWMGLSAKGYGIHGTNAPTSIGKRASKGCIRMAQADLEELFEMVRVGDVVVLEAARTAEVAEVFATPQTPAAPTVAPGATAPAVVAVALPIGK